jgi:hypothetical protein
MRVAHPTRERVDCIEASVIERCERTVGQVAARVGVERAIAIRLEHQRIERNAVRGSRQFERPRLTQD